jgi:hypothetical protein
MLDGGQLLFLHLKSCLGLSAEMSEALTRTLRARLDSWAVALEE